MMGSTLLYSGDIVESRVHFDQAKALYDPAEHRAPTTRFGSLAGGPLLATRSNVLWTLGYPEAALADAKQALNEARESGQAATLMLTLSVTARTLLFCRYYEAAKAQCDEGWALADQKGSSMWKPIATFMVGAILAFTDNPTDAIQTMTSGLAAHQLTGATLLIPFWSSHLARAHAETGHFDDAWRCIERAVTSAAATKEGWCQAEIHRIAGEIALMSPAPDAAKAKGYFDRALTVARAQQAKSWELRAAMSMARLWRDQGKRNEARELLAPVYGWFTEGFDTLDLKEARELLDELSS
jgi:predicted ATPase